MTGQGQQASLPMFFAYKYRGRESRRGGQQKEEKKKKRRERKQRVKERKNRGEEKKRREEKHKDRGENRESENRKKKKQKKREGEDVGTGVFTWKKKKHCSGRHQASQPSPPQATTNDNKHAPSL
jgi:hypothetical protein